MKLMKEFTLHVDERFLDSSSEKDLPEIPLCNIVIVDDQTDDIIKIIKKYSATIETMTLGFIELSFEEIARLLNATTRLKKLVLYHIHSSTKCDSNVVLPYLRVLQYKGEMEMLIDYNDFFEQSLRLFKHNSSIEELLLEIEHYRHIYNINIGQNSFYSFLATLPNLKRLVLGSAIREYTDDSDDSTRFRYPSSPILGNIETLCVEYIYAERLRLLPKKRSLHELQVAVYPHVQIMRAIEEMNIKNLYIGGKPMVLNYEKQHVDYVFLDLDGNESDTDSGRMESAIEWLRHGKCK
jgi:hypothetical protein